ncbi:protein of unknown function [Shinella sp. WSC3-e]|nr:protein of unknown function [Shinella sp. WSC3-e]
MTAPETPPMAAPTAAPRTLPVTAPPMIAPETAPIPAPFSVCVQLATARPTRTSAMTFFMKIFSKVERRPRLPGPPYPLLLRKHTAAVFNGEVCPRPKIYPEIGKSMAFNYFFDMRINIVSISFDCSRPVDRSREISRLPESTG